ncbi:MAG TPA: helix-turn-helix transcriptional regulator [Candidatus Cybelea sp.]|nr:helix-turn-helix transcriptional regulator [Candidatus Cybelea sp.]
MTIDFPSIKKRLLSNPKVRQAYDDLAPEFEIAAALVKARSRAGMTQAAVARRMGTTQSVIARLESGRQKVSTRTLLRFAEATGTRLKLELVPRP